MFLVSGVGPGRKADNLTATYQLTVYIMWHPQHITSLQASMAWYGGTFQSYLQDNSCFISLSRVSSQSPLQEPGNFTFVSQS
jgi:hypothetical protein